jgi:hypothetical protein
VDSDFTVTLAFDDVVPIATLPENGASLISPVSATSIDGIPETSFTENMVPVKLFVIENNCPADPVNDKELSSNTLSVIGVLPEPVNLIVG